MMMMITPIFEEEEKTKMMIKTHHTDTHILTDKFKHTHTHIYIFILPLRFLF